MRAQVAKIVEALHKPVLICETGYPATAKFGGQFAAWNLPVEGCSFSDLGQAKWLADLVAVIRQDPNFAGVFYWSPEWYDGGLWDAFALFDAHGVARPGVRSFLTTHNDQPASKASIAPTVRQRTQNRIEDCIEAPAHVRGEEPYHKVSIFLQQQVFAPIASISLLPVQVL